MIFHPWHQCGFFHMYSELNMKTVCFLCVSKVQKAPFIFWDAEKLVVIIDIIVNIFLRLKLLVSDCEHKTLTKKRIFPFRVKINIPLTQYINVICSQWHCEEFYWETSGRSSILLFGVPAWGVVVGTSGRASEMAT